MFTGLQHWLANIALDDPIERRQAKLVQVMVMAILVAAIGRLLINMALGSGLRMQLFIISYHLPVIVLTAAALVLLRRGHFQWAVMLTTIGIISVLAYYLGAVGLSNSRTTLYAFTVPIMLAGLLTNRRNLMVTMAISIASVAAIGIMELQGVPFIGVQPELEGTLSASIASFIMTTTIVGVFLDRFGNTLRTALQTSLVREKELEQIRSEQADTIAARTASLQDALKAVELREASLSKTLDELRASQAAVRELSAPVVPVLRGVLVAPLIGALDSERARELTENVLNAVMQQQARYVIFDITGVPVVDTQVAQVLLQTTAAAQLLGAKVLLVGIRPEVAQTIISLGLDLGTLTTYPDLQEAIEWLLAQRDQLRLMRPPSRQSQLARLTS